MSSWAQWKDIEALAKAIKGQKPRLILIDRPIYLHKRSTDDQMCRCGCESYCAVRVETQPHIKVLIDRVTGRRRVRRPHNCEAFDRLAEKAQRILMPVRCYPEQLAAIKDRSSKISYVGGGNRSGKSETGKEAIGDNWAELGGRGVRLLWVAPTQEMTSIAVNKLVTGETTNRFARPLFPRELIRYYPKNERVKPQRIVLIDGTRIELRYASRNGGNLKGISAVFANLDEGTEVAHEINWTILVNRLMDSGGRVMVTTTPKAGHWLKERVYDRGVPYEQGGAPGNISTVELSCLQNPWIDPADVHQTIENLGGKDDPRVQREIFGKWVAEGHVLWRHWTPRVHMIEGPERAPDAWDYVNITNIAVRSLFPTGSRVDMIGGWDCNDFPQSLVIGHVCVTDASEIENPDRWHVVITDEVWEKASVEKWAQILLHVGARRGAGEKWLHGIPIIADASTCYTDTRVNRHGQGADADVLRRAGFQVRPPAYNDNRNPVNPSIRDRVNLIHRLMLERRLRIHGRCKKLLEAIEGQLADERGLPIKRTRTASDRLSGPADALGYLLYAVFYGATTAPKGKIDW